MSCSAAALRRCATGYRPATSRGATGSRSRRWTRSAATPEHSRRRCRTRCACSTLSTSPGSGSPPSTRYAAAPRLGFAAVDEVRRRVQQDSLGHRGRKDDPLFRVRRLLRRRADRLTEPGWARIFAALGAGDVDQQIALSWIAAQALRLIFTCRSRYAAEQHLHRWLTHCAEHNIPELRRLAGTIDAWRAELLAYFDTGGVSNGPTEAMNSLIKKIKRVGHGFRNFNNYRLRLLLNCGADWKTPQPARIRGRLPRLAA